MRIAETRALLGTLWSGLTGPQDVEIPGWMDEPAEGATAAGRVVVGGWCQERGGRPCAAIRVWVDGREVDAARVERYARPDVQAAVPGIGDCSRAGWRLRFAPGDLAPGPHCVAAALIDRGRPPPARRAVGLYGGEVSAGAPVASSLLAAALVAVGGLALADLVPFLRVRPLLPRLGWAWLLGCAWLGGGAYAASHVLNLSLRRGVLLPLALLPIAAAIAHRARRRGATPSRPVGPPVFSFEGISFSLLFIFGVFVTASLVANGLAVPVSDWDGKMTWVAQARFIRGARSVDAPALRDPTAWVVHPRYPVLMPVLQVAAQEIADASWDDRFVRPLYALFWPAFLLVLFDAAAARANRLAAAIATLGAACAPALAFELHAGAAGTYSDLPLACFWGAGLLLVTGEGAGLAEGLAAGLLLGAAVLTKSEGLPLAAVALTAALAWAVAGRRLAAARVPLVAAAALVSAAALLLVSWRSAIPPRYDEGQVAAVTFAALAKGSATRLPEAARACLRAMANREEWGFTWLFVPLGLALGARRLARLSALPLAVALAGALALYAAAYALSVWPAAMLAETTWDRFLVQMGLPLFVLLALALGPRPQSLFQTNGRAG